MYFDINVKIAHRQLGRSYGYAMLVITYAEIIMANINSTLADKQVGGPRQLGVPQCFFPLPSCVVSMYGISQG